MIQYLKIINKSVGLTRLKPVSSLVSEHMSGNGMEEMKKTIFTYFEVFFCILSCLTPKKWMIALVCKEFHANGLVYITIQGFVRNPLS